MKKALSVLLIVFVLFSLSQFSVSATEDKMIYDTTPLYNSLSDEVKESLHNLGIDDADPDKLKDLSFETITQEIINMASNNFSSPLKGLISIIALLLICSLISAYKSSLSSDISNTLNITATLCITCAITVPTVQIISKTAQIIGVSSNIMLAYIPIMVVIMSTSGNAISGASYYATMIATGQGVAQIASKVIVPLLNVFLGLSITGSVSKDIKLDGFTNLISSVLKWILAFSMTIFTAVLTFKQLITTSLDNVSTRAVRFTLNSFIPIVGSALSDAYKTVQSSVTLLKSGVGIFVIISIVLVFLPTILQVLLWIITLSIGKSTAEVMNLSQSVTLLQSISTVFSTLLAIILCIMSIFIISTAIVLIMGGGGS